MAEMVKNFLMGTHCCIMLEKCLILFLQNFNLDELEGSREAMNSVERILAVSEACRAEAISQESDSAERICTLAFLITRCSRAMLYL